jgi:hypothetical protein
VNLSSGDYSASGSTTLANYTLPSSVSGAIGTITKAHLTVAADPQSRLYGASNPTFSETISGYVDGENLSTSGVTGTGAGSSSTTVTTGVGNAIIKASSTGLSAANYDFPNLVDGTLSIIKAHLTVTADDKTRLYGDANPTLTSTISGYVNNENASSANVTGAPAVSTTATATTVGTAAITAAANSLAADNYDFAYAPGTLTIDKVTYDAQQAAAAAANAQAAVAAIVAAAAANAVVVPTSALAVFAPAKPFVVVPIGGSATSGGTTAGIGGTSTAVTATSGGAGYTSGGTATTTDTKSGTSGTSTAGDTSAGTGGSSAAVGSTTTTGGTTASGAGSTSGGTATTKPGTNTTSGSSSTSTVSGTTSGGSGASTAAGATTSGAGSTSGGTTPGVTGNVSVSVNSSFGTAANVSVQTAQISSNGNTTTFTPASSSESGNAAGSGGLTGTVNESSSRTTAIVMFSQSGGKINPAGLLTVVEQGNSLKATSTATDVSSIPDMNPERMRFITVDYAVSKNVQSLVTVGISPEGTLVIQVSASIRNAMTDVSISLLGIAIARERFDVIPGNVKGVVIQVQ